jgi:hypothetical protein
VVVRKNKRRTPTEFVGIMATLFRRSDFSGNAVDISGLDY